MPELWSFQHSVACAVSKEFAWNFWTEVRNWALDPDTESVSLDGPFQAGSRGVTVSKSSGRIEWRVAEAQHGFAAVEISAGGALARFGWTFEESGTHTLITQRATISADARSEFIDAFATGLESGMPAGMQKLCEAIEAAATSKDK